MSQRIPRKIALPITRLLFIFFSILFVTPHSQALEGIARPVYAATNGPEAAIIEQFVRQGMRCLQQNDAQGAVDQFARVLMLDPSNKEAREGMISNNVQTPLPAAQRIQLFLADDLLAFNERLQKKLNYFTAKRDALVATLLQQNYPQTLIDREFQAVRDRFFHPADNRDQEAASTHPLEALNRSLMREQEKLSRELFNVREEIARLRKIPKTETQAASPIKTRDQMEPWQQIAGVREELNELRQHVQILQKDVKSKDDRITALTKQVVEFSLKLIEQEMILNEKVNALGSLHDAYMDLQSRQELGLKILEEKNVQIQSLQEGLAALQADTALHTKEINSLIAAKDQALDQWEEILAIYQGKLKDATRVIEARDNALGALQEQLASVNTKLFEKETALEKTKEKLAGLEKQFQSIVSDAK